MTEQEFYINEEIKKLFDSRNPFALVRMGNTEGHYLEDFFMNRVSSPGLLTWLTTAGIYPNDLNYLKDIWAPINTDAMEEADILGFVDISSTIGSNDLFKKQYVRNKPSFFKENLGVLNPITLSNIENPWTEKLKNKKVLIVSSFDVTIKEQWKNIDNVWGNKKDLIVPFDLVNVIRSPYHPYVDDRQFPKCYTWHKTLEELKSRITDCEYDILLIGAGSFAPSLAVHAKRSGKIGITLCGDTQLYFGIKGSRWADNPQWNRVFNDHWIYPLEEDIPNRKEIFDRIERAYWK